MTVDPNLREIARLDKLVNELRAKLDKQNKAFNALHAVYHERDFRVRVNDPTINFVRRILAECLGANTIVEIDPKTSSIVCPACKAGHEPFVLQPNSEDRKR
jgi:hypothetical protein